VTLLVSRKEAKILGISKYFTGKPCSKSLHISERFVNNGNCVQCEKERTALWKNKNKEKLQKYRADYWSKNKSTEYVNHRAWVKENPEKVDSYKENKNKATSVWASNNKYKRNLNEAKRRFYKTQQLPKWLTDIDKLEIECIYKYCDSLRKIGLDYHVDHIIPLRGKHVSGLHVPSNLQVIPAFQNLSKGNR